MIQTEEVFGNDLTLPENFEHTAPPLLGRPQNPNRGAPNPLPIRINPQTTLLCAMLNLTDPNSAFTGKTPLQLLEEMPCASPGQGGDSDDVDDFDDAPSFIDSSMDQSSVMNSSSGFDSFNETKNLNASVLSNLDEIADNQAELQSILSAQKINLSSTDSCKESSYSSISTVSSTDTKSDLKTDFKLTKRQSIADRLRSLKNDNSFSSSSPVSSSIQEYAEVSQSDLQSVSSLSKSVSLSSLVDDEEDELQSILKRQQSTQSSKYPSLDISSTDAEAVCASTPDPASKKRNSSEMVQTPQLQSQTSSHSLKKMKRRNVSAYEQPQE